jgi:hypothetical protein
MFQSHRARSIEPTHPDGPQRPDGALPRSGPAAHARPGLGRATRARFAGVALLIACAGLPLAAAAADCAGAGSQAHGPGAVFDSVEAAAIDALSHAHRTATLTDRQRLRVGVIHRVAGGYSYTAAKRSGTSSPLMPHRVRYRLRASDVGRYIIPARSAKLHVNRMNEEPTREEKRIVDELDPAHRPLYQLTPSLNVVSYHQGGRTHVVANLNDLALEPVSMASVVEGEFAISGALCAIRSTNLFARSVSVKLPD